MRPRCDELRTRPVAEPYLTCFATRAVIWNMLTCALPPNTNLSLSSALMLRRFFLSWSPFFLMYAQIFFVSSVRGIGVDPTTAPSTASGCTGFMNAAFGLRFAFFAFFAAGFLAFFFEGVPLSKPENPLGVSGCGWQQRREQHHHFHVERVGRRVLFGHFVALVRRLQNERNPLCTRVREQPAKRLEADLTLTDQRMPVLVRRERVLAVIQVKEPGALTDGLLERIEHRALCRGAARDVVAAGKQMAAVEPVPRAMAQFSRHAREHPRDFFGGSSHRTTGSRGVLDQYARAALALGHHLERVADRVAHSVARLQRVAVARGAGMKTARAHTQRRGPLELAREPRLRARGLLLLRRRGVQHVRAMHEHARRHDPARVERLAELRRAIRLDPDLLVVVRRLRREQLQRLHLRGGRSPHRHHRSARVGRMRAEESSAHSFAWVPPPGLMSIMRALPRYSTLVGLLSCRSRFTTSAIRRAICAIVTSASSFSSASSIPASMSAVFERSAASGLLISCCSASDVSPMPARYCALRSFSSAVLRAAWSSMRRSAMRSRAIRLSGVTGFDM